ncbi:MAG: CDP-alcohol phosphatidyltransferase family protein [Spirochaetales bacterium]|nr:CDP-alcohol phosphatidyltransferase family protein [Spirochaetales bacterium]
MMTDRTNENNSQNPSMISFIKDPPNICSLLGLLSALIGIYFAIAGNFSLAMVGVIWAVVFDWTDGIVARRLKGRTKYHRLYGGQLDSLIDVVSFGVFPAIFLLSYGGFNLWFLPGSFIIVAVGVIRLSYFNVFGLVDKKTYMGLALDNNVIILAFVFLFERFFQQETFAIIMYILLVGMSAFNLASVKTPKFTGKWFYVLIGYSLILTVIYGWL